MPSSKGRKWAAGLGFACAASWLLPGVVAIAYGVWALTSAGAPPEGNATGPGPIVDGVIGALGVVALVAGASMVLPGLLLLGSSAVQIRRGVGHSATLSVLLAIATMLALLGAVGLDQVMSSVGLAVGLPVLALHLAALAAAFWHAETRRDRAPVVRGLVPPKPLND